MKMGGLFFRGGRIVQSLAVGAVLALPLASTGAEADTRLCRQLEAQLAASPAGRSASSSQLQRYDTAIARQQEQIRIARDQGKQAGCGRAMAGAAISFCASLNATTERMQKNLVDIQRQRAQIGGRDSKRERARILAAIDANGCRQPQKRLPVETSSQAPKMPQHGRMQSIIDGSSRSLGGTLSGRFRTMCVRTCDGYYFPISNSVPQSGFARDQQACAAMCPGTQVELHYHRMPGQESEDMVSAITGLPYRQMSNAFLYRRQDAPIPAGCTCGAAAATIPRGFEVIGGDYAPVTANDEAEQDTPAIPLPKTRPDPAEDPETLASREGGLDAATLKRLATPARAAPADASAEESGERQVRVVGPQFLPDPAAAIDLQVQAPARAR